MHVLHYELFSVVLYLAALMIIVSRVPQKDYLSIIAATPFIFLSECLVLTLTGKYLHSIQMTSLFYKYSTSFGTLLYRIPWVLPFSNGWFWGIPLLICYTLHRKIYQEKEEKGEKGEKIEILTPLEEMDEIERVKRTRELFKRQQTSKYFTFKFFLPIFIFMGWDIIVEYLAIQRGLWSYPYGSLTVGGLPSLRFFTVGFTGWMMVVINNAIATPHHRRTLRSMRSPEQIPLEVHERSWAWNILARIIIYNAALIFYLMLMFLKE